MDMFLLTCECGQKMKVPESYFGKIGACPKCKKRLRISRDNTRKLAAAKRGAETGQSARKRLGELLVEEQMITPAQLEEALHTQKQKGGKIGEVLVALGYLSVTSFAQFLAKQPGVASIDLTNYEVSQDLLGLVPREFALTHDVFPLDRLGKLLTVGMACPIDANAIAELEELTGLRVKALLCALPDIKAVIERYYQAPAPQEPDAGADDAMLDAVAAPPEHSEAKHTRETPAAGLWLAPEDTSETAAAVEKALAPMLKLENVAALVREIDALPALPDTVQRVQNAMDDPEVSVRDVVDVIQTDPTVAARILSVANSAAYGFPNRVDSVSLAATLLGLQEVYSLVLSSAVWQAIEQFGRPEYRQFWTRSMAHAPVLREIAKACGHTRKTGLYAAWLLHDIGQIALLEAAPKRYAQINAALRGRDLIAAEEEHLGLAHPEAGYLLASKWGLPVQITEPARFHHAFSYAQEALDITALVSVTTGVVDLMSQEALSEEALRTACGDALDYLGLEFETLGALAPEFALAEAQ